MTPITLGAPLTVVRFWGLFRAAAPGVLDHPDPQVRWREHRRVGRAFAVAAKRLGARIAARDEPTGLADTGDPRTTAVFTPLAGTADAALVAWAARFATQLTRRIGAATGTARA